MTTLSNEIRQRIFAAADTLYVANGQNGFPTVDAVRKSAKVNMNDASEGMREWRKIQKSAQAAPVEVELPEVVRMAGLTALAQVWRTAQELANEGLIAAQAMWEAERQELQTLNREMAEAFERLQGDMDVATAAHRDLVSKHDSLTATNDQLLNKFQDLREQQAASTARAAELERRNNEARIELDAARTDLIQVRADLGKVTVQLQGAVELNSQQQSRIDTLTIGNEELHAQLQDSRAQQAAAAAQCHALDEQHRALTTKHAQVSEANDDLRQQLATSEARASMLERLQVDLRAELDTSRTALAQALADAANAHGQRLALDDQNRQLMERFGPHSDKD